MNDNPCPNCGHEIKDHICYECKFDVNDIFKCPIKEEDKCKVTSDKCDIDELGYETCEVFRDRTN